MCPVVIIFIQISPNNSKWQFKKIFEVTFAYVTNDTAETIIKIKFITTPHVKRQFVTAMAWQATTCCTDRSCVFLKYIVTVFNILI
jgi:hypothetical protein